MKKHKHHSPVLDVIEEKNKNLVDFLMLDVEIDKSNPFVTESKVRDQLYKIVTQDEVNTRFIRGLDLAMDDLSRHLPKTELNAINEELRGTVDKMIPMMLEKSATPEESVEKLVQTPDSFQELLGISENTINQFFQSGYRYYETAHFAEASDVLFAVNVLNPFKYNGWLALGMAEKQCGHFNEALQAFTMAALIDLTAVYPHLHSAECYRALKSEDDVKKTLDYALSILEEQPTADAQKIKDYIYNFNKK